MNEISFVSQLGDTLEQTLAPKLNQVRRRRLLPRWMSPRLATGLGVLAIGGGVATAATLIVNYSRLPPRQLFSVNLQRCYTNTCRIGRVPIKADSIRDVETVEVPGVGGVQYWVARSTTGMFCTAFKLPDGTWGGTIFDRHYNFGGTVPGCSPQNTLAAGHGFYLDNNYFSRYRTREGHLVVVGHNQMIEYGLVDLGPRAVEVRDARTGATTRIHDHHYFALVIPAHQVPAGKTPGGTSGNPKRKIWFSGPGHLVALDSQGRVIARVDTR